ncbi:1,2-phenylacetyl-CoA epoxidase subunit PaaD [Natrinema altunense]|uniref:Metal-sulfur cluster assembly factor n=1 Tax=Natrinema altunense TaxID=222984 RepID=A0A482XZ30_9EURY|nr:1,2-phenylacetyl-CoA epoxidase subunit PaaD [Natrinema altunense]RZH67810.1 metal-sulfur cluster assembly factor [Natrinema altunense]
MTMPTNAPTDSEACTFTDFSDGDPSSEYPKTGSEADGIEAEVWKALYEVEDPEMPVSIVDLGLIYDIDIADSRCDVAMTLTYTGCPAREMLLNDVKCAAETVPAVDEATVELRYTPEWNVSMVTEEGRDSLRDFGLSV